MVIYIKNMVCTRCKMVVKSELERLGFHPISTGLGEVELDRMPTETEKKEIAASLIKFGFELINDKKSRLIEKVKTLVIELIQNPDNGLKTNLSDFLSGELLYEYNYISNLFSEVEGMTIEKYFISQKIEKVKELLVYDELSLSEIAYQLNYSSVAYLSNQFRKVTGFTPTYFKKIKENKRHPIDEL